MISAIWKPQSLICFHLAVLLVLVTSCQPIPVNTSNTPVASETQPILSPTSLPPPAPSRVELLTQLTIGKINRMEVSPDGDYLAVAAASGLFLYQESTLELVWGSATSGGVTQVIWSPNGSRLGGVIGQNILVAWDAHTGNLIRSLETQTDYVYDLGWLSGGDRLIWLASDDMVHIWDPVEDFATEINAGDLIGYDLAEGGPAAYTPDVSLVAISGWKYLTDGDVTTGSTRLLIMMDAATGKALYILEDISLYSLITFSSDGSLLITGSTIRDPTNGEILRTLENYPSSAENITFSPDGTMLSVNSSSNSVTDKVFIWDLTTGELLHVFEGHEESYRVTDAVWSSDGSRIATGSTDKTVVVWDVKNGEQLQKITGMSTEIIQVDFSSDGNVIYVLSEDAHIVAWDIRTGNWLRDIRSAFVRIFTWSPDDSILTGGGEYNVFVWGVEDQNLKYVFDNPVNSWTRDLQISPDSSILGILLPDSLDLRDVKTGEVLNSQIRTPGEGARSISSFAWSPDGNFLATGWEDGRVVLLDSRGEQIVRRLQSTSSYDTVFTLTFSPDGRRLAAGTSRSTMIWNVESGELLHVLGNQPQFDTVAWSADGRMIASTGAYNSKLEVWDAVTGETLFSSPLQSSAGKLIAWSPAKPLLFATDGTARVLIWNAETGETSELTANNETFWQASWSFNGALLAATIQNSVLIWDTSTWNLFQTLEGYSGMNQLAFSPNGKMLATGSWGGVLSLWELIP